MPVKRKLEADGRVGPRGAGWGVLGQRQEEGSYSLRPHFLNSVPCPPQLSGALRLSEDGKGDNSPSMSKGHRRPQAGAHFLANLACDSCLSL